MLEFLKLVMSKDFWSNTKEILSFFKKSKEWEKNIVSYRGSFSKRQKFKAEILLDSCLKKLGELGWSEDEIVDNRIIINEILDNAFEYGLKTDSQKVTIEAMFSENSLQICFIDYGLNFDLHREYEKQLSSSDKKVRLHGIYRIFQITTEISQEKFEGKNRVSFIKRRGEKRVVFEEKEKKIYVVKVFAGNQLRSVSFWEKVKSIVSSESRLIIDIRGAKSSSRNISEIGKILSSRDLSSIAKENFSDKIAIVIDYDPYHIEYFSDFNHFLDIEKAEAFFESKNASIQIEEEELDSILDLGPLPLSPPEPNLRDSPPPPS